MIYNNSKNNNYINKVIILSHNNVNTIKNSYNNANNKKNKKSLSCYFK
jgi:hypothetical protein